MHVVRPRAAVGHRPSRDHVPQLPLRVGNLGHHPCALCRVREGCRGAVRAEGRPSRRDREQRRDSAPRLRPRRRPGPRGRAGAEHCRDG